MEHTNEAENRCFICNKEITEQDMVDGKVEMIDGPDRKKVFVCISHLGVAEEVKKESK
jgi:hypothetical protein